MPNTRKGDAGDNQATAAAAAGGGAMGMPFKTYLACKRVWSCNHCGAHLANNEVIVSKQFHGRHGRAYLFEDVINVGTGKMEERRLLTGVHVVSDIFCNVCNNRLGWKYIRAFAEKEKYKEGKFLVEKARMMKDQGWSEP